MANAIYKERVMALRKQGQSIGSIALVFGISKSTVSSWCKNISLTQKQVDKIFNKAKEKSIRALIKYQELARASRQSKIVELTKEGIKDVGELFARDLYILGLGLYWTEGYKKGNDELGFTNMDPFIIKTLIRWLKDNYKVENYRFVLRVSINIQHKQRESKILKYWSNQTKIPTSQFTKTSFVKTKSAKQYLNNHNHFGTLRVKVKRATDLRRKILGSIRALSEKFGR